jgi:hypothetical protein
MAIAIKRSVEEKLELSLYKTRTLSASFEWSHMAKPSADRQSANKVVVPQCSN